jgi:hypothetical protein
LSLPPNKHVYHRRNHIDNNHSRHSRGKAWFLIIM